MKKIRKRNEILNQRLIKTGILFIFLIFVSLVTESYAAEKNYKKNQISFLKQVVKDTYEGMHGLVNKKTGLPYDVVKRKSLEVVESKTSPTEIGEWLVVVVIARALGIISKDEARYEIIKTLDTLERLRKYKGFLYQWYDAKTGDKSSNFVPSIDNLNFDACVLIAAQAIKQSSSLIYKRLKKILDMKNYRFFYRRINKKAAWLNHGYKEKMSRYSSADYGHFLTEIGLSVIPIIENEVPKKILISTQVPVRNCKLLEKSYFNEKWNFNFSSTVGLSWDGSLFNSFFPYIFMGEKVLTKEIIVNLKKHVLVHMEYAKRLNLPFWGWSPAWGSRGDEYLAWGVPHLADWGGGFGVKQEIKNKGYKVKSPEVSPYSSFLVIGTFSPNRKLFKSAINNLIEMKKCGYGYGKYGFYDSINMNREEGGKYKVSLDEGMVMIGAYNALQHLKNKKGIEKYFWNYFNEKDFKITKRIFSKIGSRKFTNLNKGGVKKASKKISGEKFVSVDNHTVNKGGWGFGLASCMSRQVYDEEKGMIWQLKYNIVNDFGGGYIKLNRLDPLKEYNYLVLKAKAGSNDNTRGFKIEIKEPGVNFPPILKYPISNLPTDKWKKFIVPLRGNISKKEEKIIPSEITIVFDSAISGTNSGNILISDIWFHKE